MLGGAETGGTVNHRLRARVALLIGVVLLCSGVTVGAEAGAAAPSSVASPKIPASSGYRLVASDGGVFCYGTAQFFGSMAGSPLNTPGVGTASVG